MIVIEDLEIMYDYWDNGNIRWFAEYKDNPNNHTGIYAEWFYNGAIKELSYRKNNRYHGLKKYWIPTEAQSSSSYVVRPELKYYVRYYFIDGVDICDKISKLVKDVENITDEEKIYVAMTAGIIL